jgi:hypothetical protein
MNVVIVIEVEDESADPDDSTGLTESAYDTIMDAIGSIGSLVSMDKEGA